MQTHAVVADQLIGEVEVEVEVEVGTWSSSLQGCPEISLLSPRTCLNGERTQKSYSQFLQ